MSFFIRGKQFTFHQPDGMPFEVRGWGDQHHAVFETLDSYTVVKDPQTGFWQLAQLDRDADELNPCGARADSFEGAALGLDRRARISGAAAVAKGREAFRMMGSQRRCEQRRQRARSTGQSARLFGMPMAAAPSRTTVGDYVGLCLLIDFSDDTATIPQTEVDDFCNLQGYTGSGNNGSVYDYFYDNSNGQFRYQNIVTAYYRARHPKTYYTDPSIRQATRARQLIREALDNLVAQGFDFRVLTVDAGGFVYAMNVFYAGFVQNNWSEGLWPHSWHLAAPYDLGSGIKAYDYQFTDMSNEVLLGTFCHENGHMVCDYPDLYDYGNESNGVGRYCLMCAGTMDERNPAQISAYLKYKSGWSTSLTPITHGVTISLSSKGSNFAILKQTETEYFIIENRNQSGRDDSIPDAGLAIWHVDELASNDNEQRSPTEHYELSLEQADGRFDLENRTNNGDTGDLFHQGGVDRFANDTVPSSKWWNGVASDLTIYDISNAADVINFSTRLRDDIEAPKVYSGSSTPGVDIPDRNPVGASDTIHIDGAAALSTVTVTVDITHTYRGDLRVTLHSPATTSVILHRRNQGGRADDLKRSYDMASLPGLSALLGESIQGDWTLQVQDLAFADVGVLNEWSLEIEGTPSSQIDLEAVPGRAIPDKDSAGIVEILATNETGNVVELEVSVDITHTWVNDLELTLISPSGHTALLRKETGGSADDIIETYTVATTPTLNDLIGGSVAGDWKLRVVDHVGLDTGKLNMWRMKIMR